MLFGIVIFVLALFVLLAWGIRRDQHSGVPIGIALIVYGLLFDALVTEGRVGFGVWGATQSRYVPNDVLVLVGIFMAALGRSSIAVQAGRAAGPTRIACTRGSPGSSKDLSASTDGLCWDWPWWRS